MGKVRFIHLTEMFSSNKQINLRYRFASYLVLCLANLLGINSASSSSILGIFSRVIKDWFAHSSCSSIFFIYTPVLPISSLLILVFQIVIFRVYLPSILNVLENLGKASKLKNLPKISILFVMVGIDSVNI